jgi:hypothetical protein
MKTFKEYITESTTVTYHGDNFNTKKLDIKLMNNGNNQEGIGIYFGSLETAQSYGKNIVKAEIDTKKFIDSRGYIGDFVAKSKIIKLLTELYKSDNEEFYYFITDYVEVMEPEDVNKQNISELADMLSDEQVRNFQITLAEKFGVVVFVELWNKIIKIDGTYQEQNSDETWYCIINTNIKLSKI